MTVLTAWKNSFPSAYSYSKWTGKKFWKKTNRESPSHLLAWTETVCCSSKASISGSKLKALFAIWLHWVVRLDISHHTRRPASKCQRKSEPLKHVSTKNLTFFIQTLYSSATLLVLFVFEPLAQLGSFLVYCLCIFVALGVFLSSFVGDFHFSCLFNTFS